MSEYAADLNILDPERLDVPPTDKGEGPCWDEQTQSLYWVDISAGRVHRLSEAGVHSSWDVGTTVGAVVTRASGGLVAAADNGFVALDILTGEVTELAHAPGKPGSRMNDGKCDRAGRFYAGSVAEDDSPGKGSFYRLDPDGTVTVLMTDLGISNGLGWSPDNTLMYYTDSLDLRVDVMDYDAATGELGERRPFISLGSEGIVPDGLTVDAEGGVWVAVWGGGVVQRYDPSGRLTGVARLPVSNVTSCTFGGPGLRRLYITTAAGPGRLAGSLFTCEAGVTGQPAHPYRG